MVIGVGPIVFWTTNRSGAGMISENCEVYDSSVARARSNEIFLTGCPIVPLARVLEPLLNHGLRRVWPDRQGVAADDLTTASSLNGAMVSGVVIIPFERPIHRSAPTGLLAPDGSSALRIGTMLATVTLISPFSHLVGLVECGFGRCAAGKSMEAMTSCSALSIKVATFGRLGFNCLTNLRHWTLAAYQVFLCESYPR